MKYIIWDFDGTLAYREGLWTGTLMSLLHKNNILHIEKEDIRPFLSIGFTWNSPDTPHEFIFKGKSWWEYYEIHFKKIFELAGLDESRAAYLAKKVREEYMDRKMWHLYDDVIVTLKKVKEIGFENIILSNHIPELIEITEALGIKNYFRKIYSSANIGYEKPNVKIFEYVINDLKTGKGDCIMVGDSYEADVAGALRSGIKVIMVRKENPKEYRWYETTIEGVPVLAQKRFMKTATFESITTSDGS